MPLPESPRDPRPADPPTPAEAEFPLATSGRLVRAYEVFPAEGWTLPELVLINPDGGVIASPCSRCTCGGRHDA